MLRHTIFALALLTGISVCLAAVIPDPSLQDALKLTSEQPDEFLSRQQRAANGFGHFGGHGHHGGYDGHHGGYGGHHGHGGGYYPGDYGDYGHHHHHHHHSPYHGGGHYGGYPDYGYGYGGYEPGFGIYFG